jgi:polyisoprenoid-binding protein YceI
LEYPGEYLTGDFCGALDYYWVRGRLARRLEPQGGLLAVDEEDDGSMIRLGPSSASCHVLTCREGLLSSFGHDLELAVTRFDIRVDEVQRAVDASFDATSLRVVRALRDGAEVVDALSASDRRTIEDTLRSDVLEANRHREIRFQSSCVADVEDGFDVTGRLLLHGKECDVVIPLRRVEARYTADIRLHQPDFGIRPYTALLGALKVKPEVTVRISLPADPPR